VDALRPWSEAPAGDDPPAARLWLCDIDRPPVGPDTAAAVLDDDERARRARFVFQRDRDRYLASHLFLRAVLACHAGVDPAALRFTRGPHGKPVLEPACVPGVAPAFNLSHSGARALLAIVPGAAEVGVDIERWRPDRRFAAIAERNFSPPECRYLDRFGAAARAAAFYRVWTLKEAYVKARSTGLTLPLHGFRFGFGPGGELGLAAESAVDATPGRWHCAAWELPGSYSAALVHDAPRTLPLRWFEAVPLVGWRELEVAVGFRTPG
jgi:4'-phosphopantetheinyl transferase